MVHVPLAASEGFRGKSGSGLLGDAIEELDWSVGQIMQTLKELQLDEKTLVIFTSDNGAAAGSSAPWRGKKASNFEGGVREPCLMRWPGQIPAGTTCNQIAGQHRPAADVRQARRRRSAARTACSTAATSRR